MLSEGDEAPAVSLPAYVDGERRTIDLQEYLGEGIVVLAFYPADFNPACTMQASDLGDLDLFTMQKDVSVFAVSPDSTYSHEAFADRYSLHVPLLSDRDGDAAEAYDVALETDLGERLVQRAAFVVDHRGTVQYAWATDDLEAQIDVAPVKRAVGDIGGDDTAIERYRVGHDHYVEGREAFTEAMADYEDREWMDARNGFEEAEPAFTTAADHFDTAVRFAETGDFETVVDRTEEKADTLSHAAKWLTDSADAFASGRGKQGAEYREDAERLLDAAEDLSEPPDPDAFALTDDGVEVGESVVVHSADEDGYDLRADDADAVDTDLDLADDALDAVPEGESAYDDASAESDTVEGDLEMDVEAVEAADADDDGERSAVEGDTVEGDLEMDLDVVEDATDGDESDGGAASSPRSDAAETSAEREGAVDPADAPGGGSDASDGGESAGEGDEEDEVEELDLVDPTEGDDEAEEDDERADWDIPGR
ncbi:redoxin domain-containing protein [Halosimplex aquaticum]|uniref:thioredoxin-dependent peroxiredoxin n=1 Tax=Halosimplex aquaticum TaxID=3026162 RepID=A0ABD5Y2E9_9EURY|nr:redoxin domain-containing protein [Halosimplex aquaticum]